MGRHFRRLSLLVAISYLALGFIGSVCMFGGTADPVSHHSHTGKKASHSALCAWVCQIGPSASHRPGVIAGEPTFLVLVVALILVSLKTTSLLSLGQSRAPPVSILLKHSI